MVPSTNAAYVKLIVSCLDYEFDHCYLSKVILQKALTSTCENARRWCTRFLSALAYRRLPKFSEWGFRLLLGQLGDQSVKVIRHAIRVLHTWLPTYRDAARWLRTAQLDNFGEAGTLLKAHIFADEHLCELDPDGTRDAIAFWMEVSFNVKYVEAIDDEMRAALLSVRRTINGTFSRTSGERTEGNGLRVPPHLFASLAIHEFGRSLLCELNVIDNLHDSMSNEGQPTRVKAALMALSHIGSCDEGFKLLPDGLIPQIIRMAEEAPVLSVRGYAYWALTILSTSISGAEVLVRFGWESNHHYDTVIEKIKMENEVERESSRTASAQALSRTVKGDSDTLLVATVARCRSNSVGAIGPVVGTFRVDSRLRRTKSATAIYRTNDPKKISARESEDTPSRYERAITGDSVFTSGLGSLSEDSTADGRRATALDSIVVEWESRSRVSTIVYCLNQGFVANRSQLVVQGTVADMVRDPHFANPARERWKLMPLRTKRFLEEMSLSRYRREMLADPWLFDELLRFKTETPGTVQKSHAVPIVALPSDIDVMCLNVFPSRRDQSQTAYSSEANDKLEDRGARSGHSRSQRSDARITHSAYRCFYCSLENKVEFVLPQQEDISQLRREVLNQVDMLEIQQVAPEKKLLQLRCSYPWLFEWPCLYADVLELLDEYRFKSKSRAFLQEIFYNALKL
ncbi:unnamed protein product [Nippostrongylus brasiliensis]|uniref:Rapamycin-insensitive companion of mTOR (inferred by orthology to a human protein) n=1 Tax=Nippostrongylus brasiliensis TaxID=27835 RepID=A0A158QXV4_NIPBR|nr:unnamed protein product [Nippostrongylus brasiliensis]